MKIAIIDDNLLFIDEFKKIIISRINHFNITNFTISSFLSPEKLITNIDSFDLLFIDIEINQYNGINICNQIRKINKKILIVFISSYTTYVFNSFTVAPFSYILKKNLKTTGISEIDRCLQFYVDENKFIEILSSGIKYSLSQKEIKIISKTNDKCFFHYKNKQFEARVNLKDILPKLSSHFIQINKSEIINLNFISDINKDEIITNDQEKYYISRRKVKYVHEKWLDFLRYGG